jgi:hypothetical protein
LTDEEILASGNFVSYEKYYSEVEITNAAIDQPSRDGAQVGGGAFNTQSYGIGSSNADGSVSFEQFIKDNASANIFDNDLLEQQYKFWENPTDREKRLRKLWIDLKRKNAFGGIDATTFDEQQEINT